MANYTWYKFNPKSSNYQDYMTYQKPTGVYKPQAYSDNNGAYARDISAAKIALDKVNNSRPGAYQSQYADKMSGIYNQLENRRFNYDVNSDALYQALKENYINLGHQAMEDTSAQAAAYTGGYGNSYATAAGNQAYQNFITQLSDRIPELEQLALSRYQQEGQDLQTLYNLLYNQDATDYGRYRDSYTDWENERSYRDTALNNLRSMNQSTWAQNESNRYNANALDWSNYHNDAERAMEQLKQDWAQHNWAEEQTQHNYEQAVSEDQWAAELDETQRHNQATETYNQNSLDYTREQNDQSAALTSSQNENAVNQFVADNRNLIRLSDMPNSGKSWQTNQGKMRGQIINALNNYKPFGNDSERNNAVRLALMQYYGV